MHLSLIKLHKQFYIETFSLGERGFSKIKIKIEIQK